MIIKTSLSRIFVFGNPEHANKITRYSLVPSDLASNVGCQSTKKLFFSAIFLALIFLCPSIRADIVVYSNTVSDTNYINGGVNFGNTFSNTASASNIKSVSLYFANNGVLDEGIAKFATGTMNLGIYATTLNSGLYVKNGAALVTASLNMSIAPDSGSPAFYTFDFTGSPILDRNLSADARYAFFTDFSGVVDPGALHFYVNNSSYSDQNNINQNYINTSNTGVSGQSVVGTVEVAAVPEPGTLILTGSVLAVGGIGAYIKRRRKNRAQLENAA